MRTRLKALEKLSRDTGEDALVRAHSKLLTDELLSAGRRMLKAAQKQNERSRVEMVSQVPLGLCGVQDALDGVIRALEPLLDRHYIFYHLPLLMAYICP